MNTTLPRTLAAALVALLHSCALETPTAPALVLRTADRPQWLDPDDVPLYRCERGLLVCDGQIGRRSKRFCRCE